VTNRQTNGRTDGRTDGQKKDVRDSGSSKARPGVKLFLQYTEQYVPVLRTTTVTVRNLEFWKSLIRSLRDLMIDTVVALLQKQEESMYRYSRQYVDYCSTSTLLQVVAID